jgi:hypothetical protein
LAEVELRVLREADRHSVGDQVGFTTAALWWATATRQTKPEAIGAAKLAEALDTTYETTRAAMATGALNPDQARAIVHAVDALPKEVPAEIVASAEAHLVELAEHHDSRELRILGRRVLDVVAPEVAEAHELKILGAEERNAAATASFTMRPDGHGSMIGRFKIPVLAGEILAKHLDALAAPRHRAAGGQTEVAGPRPMRQLRWGTAFTEYVESRTPSQTPYAGGLAATVVVTMTLGQLTDPTSGTGVATLDTGAVVTAAQARRLACEAGIIPAVLGGPSQVLDLGRKTRFHTEPQRVAIALRDKTCRAKDCDWPPGMSHVHHPQAWSRGGGTSVDNGMLLCPRHHTLAHDPDYEMGAESDGDVTFRRRM